MLFVVSTGIEVRLLRLLDHVEVVMELVILCAAHGSPQIDYKCQRKVVKHILVEILTQLLHVVEQLVLCGDECMVLEMID